ncbi:hypothetical protein [Paraburkholderia caribensis]|uniref:hypothetical protein n=1 Tax=Paraburkholderia caribensis TaxID=75105 RepID=UPI0034D2C417
MSEATGFIGALRRKDAGFIAAQLAQNATEQSQRVAVFVDPTLGDPFPELHSSNDIPVYRLALPEKKVPRHAWPYLLLLPADLTGQRLLERSISLAQAEVDDWKSGKGTARSVCGWLSLSGDEQSLVDALTQKAILPLDDNECVVFRFYDPRVLGHLFRYLRESQFFSGLPTLHHWSFLDVDAQLLVLPQQDPPDSIAPVWFMTREQRNGVARIEALNSVLRDFGTDVALGDLVDAALARCQQIHGWTETVDLHAFGTLAVRCHASFDKHPFVAAQIAYLRRENEAFSGWANSIEDSRWRDIAAEINSGNI